MELITKAMRINTPNFGYAFKFLNEWIEDFNEYGTSIPMYLWLLTDYATITLGNVLGDFVYKSFRYVWAINDMETIENYCISLMTDLSSRYDDKLIDDEYNNQYKKWPTYEAYCLFQEAYGTVITSDLAPASSLRSLFYDEVKVGFNNSAFNAITTTKRGHGNSAASIVINHDPVLGIHLACDFKCTPYRVAQPGDNSRLADAKMYLHSILNNVDATCAVCHKLSCECDTSVSEIESIMYETSLPTVEQPSERPPTPMPAPVSTVSISDLEDRLAELKKCIRCNKDPCKCCKPDVEPRQTVVNETVVNEKKRKQNATLIDDIANDFFQFSREIKKAITTGITSPDDFDDDVILEQILNKKRKKYNN